MTVDEYQDWVREKMMADAKRAQARLAPVMSEQAKEGHARGGKLLSESAAKKREKDTPRVLDLYRQGVPATQIGQRIGRSRNYALRILRDQGVCR